MISRTNLVLAAVLAGLVALHLALRTPLPEAGAAGPLFPGLMPERVTRVEIQGPGEVERVILDRTGEGWVLTSHFDHPALDHAVRSLLNQLRALRADDLASAEEEDADAEAFGLGPSAVAVELTEADGRVVASLDIGAPRAGGGSAGTLHVRPRAGAAAAGVFRAPLLEPVESAAVSWLDTRLLAFDPAQVSGFEFELAGGRHEAHLGPDGAWEVDGLRASPAAIEASLTRAGQLYLDEVLGGSDVAAGALAGPLRLRLLVHASTSLGLAVGDAPGQTRVPAGRTVGAQTTPDWLVALSADAVARLEATLAELLRTARPRGEIGTEPPTGTENR